MKPQAEKNKDKRLQKNIARRERYAKLPERKKAIILEKNKKAYEAKKKSSIATTDTFTEAKRLERNTSKRKWYAELPKDRKEAILKKGRQAYAERRMKTRSNPPMSQTSQESHPVTQGHQDQCTSTIKSLGEREKQTGRHTSFEIGSSSSHPPEMRQSTMCFQLPQTGSILGKRITRPRTRRRRGPDKRKDDILKNINANADTLPVAWPCRYCAAKKFYREPNGFCCSNGEVALISNDIPDELYDLYTSQTEDASHFRTYARTYNNTFAFTSFGVKYDQNLCQRNKGIYTFKVQGQVYHYINEIIVTTNPSYLQLYFYDTEHELYNIMKSSPTLKADVAKKLIHILRVNPYATFFRNLTNTSKLTTNHIVIKANP